LSFPLTPQRRRFFTVSGTRQRNPVDFNYFGPPKASRSRIGSPCVRFRSDAGQARVRSEPKPVLSIHMVAGLRPPSGQPMAGCLRFAPAPIEPALVHASPSGVVGWGVWPAVRTLPYGSALRWVNARRGSGIPDAQPDRHGPRHAGNPPAILLCSFVLRLVSPTTMAFADSCPDRSRQVSPGKNTMLPCTTTAFTSTGKPDDFAELCQFVVPCRPFMRFLSIGSQVSPSVADRLRGHPSGSPSGLAVSLRSAPSPGRSPFPSWLQMVVSSFSCLVFLQGTCTPFTSRPCWAHTTGRRLRLASSPNLNRNESTTERNSGNEQLHPLQHTFIAFPHHRRPVTAGKSFCRASGAESRSSEI